MVDMLTKIHVGMDKSCKSCSSEFQQGNITVCDNYQIKIVKMLIFICIFGIWNGKYGILLCKYCFAETVLDSKKYDLCVTNRALRKLPILKLKQHS